MKPHSNPRFLARKKVLAGFVLLAVAAGVALLIWSTGVERVKEEAVSLSPPSGPPVQAPPSAVPPHHESAKAARPHPKLLPASHFREYPVVARAYRFAAEIPDVIAQQPCYCSCDDVGHRSLLDCFASNHGAG